MKRIIKPLIVWAAASISFQAFSMAAMRQSVLQRIFAPDMAENMVSNRICEAYAPVASDWLIPQIRSTGTTIISRVLNLIRNPRVVQPARYIFALGGLYGVCKYGVSRVLQAFNAQKLVRELTLQSGIDGSFRAQERRGIQALQDKKLVTEKVRFFNEQAQAAAVHHEAASALQLLAQSGSVVAQIDAPLVDEQKYDNAPDGEGITPQGSVMSSVERAQKVHEDLILVIKRMRDIVGR